MGDYVKKRKSITSSMAQSSSSPPPSHPQPSSSKRMKSSSKNNQPEMDSTVKPTLNPLDIPQIVRTICDNLEEVEDLKSVRALSKLWRDESLEQWRSTAVLVLKKEVIQALVETYRKSLSGSIKPEDENGTVFRALDKPFRNFRYPRNSVGVGKIYPLPARANKTQILWTHFLSNATFLDLGRCAVKSTDNSIAGIQWIAKHCPNLKVLDFDPFQSYVKQGQAMEFGVFEEEDEAALALQNSPLETISMGTYIFNMVEGHHIFSPVFQYNFVEKERFEKLLKIFPNLKNIWIKDGISGLLDAAESSNRKLEFLGLLYNHTYQGSADIEALESYMQTVRPSLKSLVLSLENWRTCFPSPNENKALANVLNQSQESLTRLELFICCRTGQILKRPLDLADGGRTNFPNLTRLRLCLQYWKFRNRLISFDFGSLRHMKKLKEFLFETGTIVAEDWVKRKLQVEDIQGKKKKSAVPEELLLPHLKHFHFHSNFTSEAIQFLGKVAPALTTSEIVFDKNNFPTGLETWPCLHQITLLPCSSVPRSLLPAAAQLKLVDRSRDYQRAGTPEVLGGGSRLLYKYVTIKAREFCKKTKPRY